MTGWKSAALTLITYLAIVSFLLSMLMPISFATPTGFYVHVKEEPVGARIQFSRNPAAQGWTDVNPSDSWQTMPEHPVFVRNIGGRSGVIEEGRDLNEDGTIDRYSNPTEMEPDSEVMVEPGKLQNIAGKVITLVYDVTDLIGSIFRFIGGKPAYADVYIEDGSYVRLETSVKGTIKFTLLAYSGSFSVRVYSAKDPTSRYLTKVGEYVLYDSNEYFVEQGTGAVGGIVVPVDKFGLLAPYIGLASTTVIAAVATAVYVKRVKRKEKKQ